MQSAINQMHKKVLVGFWRSPCKVAFPAGFTSALVVLSAQHTIEILELEPERDLVETH